MATTKSNTAMLAGLAAAVLVVRAAVTPVGEWRVTVEWPDEAREVRMSVTQVDGVLRVGWRGPRGSASGRDVRWDPPVLSFAIDAETPSGPVALRIEGRIDGDHIEGAIVTPSGAKLPLKGRRE